MNDSRNLNLNCSLWTKSLNKGPPPPGGLSSAYVLDSYSHTHTHIHRYVVSPGLRPTFMVNTTCVTLNLGLTVMFSKCYFHSEIILLTTSYSN